MKQLFLLSALVALIIAGGCKKKEDDPPPPSTTTTTTPTPSSEWGSSIQTDVAGTVLDESGQAMSGVAMQVGSATATTDVNGAFYISNATVYENLGYVTASSPGYFPGSRSFLPTTGTDVVNIRMLAKNSAGSFAATTGGTVLSEGVNISFTSSTFEQNGTAYTGNVNVALNFIDPESNAFADEMPGTLLGMQNSTSTRLTSYGMVAVELTDNSGNEVDLVSGSTAELRFPVPASLLSSAPADIDLWYFDESTGLWESEGTASLQGSEYVANVSHFSFWNCDYGGPYIYLDGQVTDPIGSGIQGARVTVTSTTQGSETDYTSSAGYFGGYVPSGEVLDIVVEVDCGGSGYQTYYTGQIGPFSSATTLPVITVVQGSLVLVTGTVTDCNNDPLTAGYVVANGQVHFLSGGAFSFMGCGASVSITPYGTAPWVGGQAVTVNLSGSSVNAGTLQVCNTGGTGTVSDIDGNVYSTVVIGTQEWMAENLRTSKYANGDPIPNVTDGTQWSNLTTGAWCHINNDSQYENPYGKLYNWFVVDSASGLCPTSWHVPTDEEWKQLEMFLGMSQFEADTIFWRGTDEGGKMKAVGTIQAGTGLWEDPNTGATNSSGFTGLPGGFRFSSGSFSTIGNFGYWWSATQYSATTAWKRALYDDTAQVYRSYNGKGTGFSVRCVRD